MRILLALNTFLISVSIASAEVPQLPIKVMPMPSSVQPGAGRLVIDRSFSLAVTGPNDAVLQHGAQRFLDQLSRETGIPLLNQSTRNDHATLEIHADHASEKVQQLGEDESYDLVVSAAAAKLTAANPLGILHGLETFLQMVTTTETGFAVPAATIHDQPRFLWRGTLIDVARHFEPVAVLKRNIDAMAAVKMNVLHLHLRQRRLPSREQEVSQTAGTRLRRHVLHAVRNP